MGMAKQIHSSETHEYLDYSLTEVILDWIDANLDRAWSYDAIDVQKDRVVLRKKKR